MKSRTTSGIAMQLRAAIAKAEKQGMTRYQIAKLAGMRHIVLKRVADGEAIPRVDTAQKILNAIGMSLTICTK